MGPNNIWKRAYSVRTTLRNDSLPRKEKDPRSFTLPCYISNVCFENALADLGASDSEKLLRNCENITLRVGDEKITLSVKPASSLIKRVYMLSLRERMDLDLEARLMGETLILNRSFDPLYGDYIELNDLNEPQELRRNRVDDLEPTIEEVLEDMDPYLDEGMGNVIVGEPFCKALCVEARRFDGIITIRDGNDSVTYQMCMRTRSSSNLIVESSTTLKHRNRRRFKQRVEPFSIEETSVVTMANQRTMTELLQAPTEGYRDAIVIPAILAKNFELKHGLLNLAINLRNEITNFQQKFEETFSEARDRFKDLLRACPHHGFTELHQLDTFYNALNPTDQDSLNVAAGGNLLTKTPRDALTIIENKSKVRNSRNKPVVSKVSANTSSTTACPSEMAALTDAVNAMLRHVKNSPPDTVKAISKSCVTCGGPYPYYECLAADGNTFNASAAAATYNQNQGYRPQGETNYHASNQMGPPGIPLVQNNQNRFNQNHGYNQNRGNNFNQGNQNYQAPPQVGPSNDLSNYMKTNDVNMRVMQNQISNMWTELKKEMDTTLNRQNNAFKNELTNDIKNMMSSFLSNEYRFFFGFGFTS
ncbi:reverse transcriptase domain-containing protein [Tanacetum coccineum]